MDSAKNVLPLFKYDDDIMVVKKYNINNEVI
jgi:hypothetical protein